MLNSRIKVSLFIAGYNELKHLQDVLVFYCTFIDDVHYFDLGSSDDSCSFATNVYNCTVHKIPKEQTIEIIHFKYTHLAKYDWIVYPDPDERWSETLLLEISRLVMSEQLGMISAPIEFYFNNKKLEGTRWGGVKTRGVAYNRRRVSLSDNVHRSKKIKIGFSNYLIFNKDCTIIHLWMQNYITLYEKHKRYLLNEGKSRYENGVTVNLAILLKTPVSSFYHSFILCKGYKDLFTGFFLSLFWVWYNSNATFRHYLYKVKHYADFNNNNKSQ